MGSDIIVRKVTQDLLMFVLFKHKIILQKPSPELRFVPEITSQLMNILCNAVRVQVLVNDCYWRGFFQKHFKRMTSSVELFTKYVIYACYVTYDNDRGAHTSFFDILSLVIYFVLRCWEAGSKKFINNCVDLICVFFETELRKKFEGQERWEKIYECIEECIDSRDFKFLLNANIRSFEHFRRRQNKIVKRLESTYSSFINELQKSTQIGVETEKKSVNLAESVAGQMVELCQKNLDEILAHFAKTDHQAEEIYRQTTGKVSGSYSTEVEYFSSRNVKEVASENIASKKSEIKELAKQIVTSSKPLDTQNSNIKFPRIDALNKALSQLNPKSEKARKLLGEISMDISKLSVIIQSLCKENGVQGGLVLLETEITG